jgi:hypothetical protein
MNLKKDINNIMKKNNMIKSRLISLIHTRIIEIDNEIKFIRDDGLLFPDEKPDQSRWIKLGKEREWCQEMIKVIFQFRRSSFYKEDSPDMLMIGKMDASKITYETEKRFIIDIKEKCHLYGHNLKLSDKQRNWINVIKKKYNI